jgi:hypothetical protein
MDHTYRSVAEGTTAGAGVTVPYRLGAHVPPCQSLLIVPPKRFAETARSVSDNSYYRVPLTGPR